MSLYRSCNVMRWYYPLMYPHTPGILEFDTNGVHEGTVCKYCLHINKLYHSMRFISHVDCHFLW